MEEVDRKIKINRNRSRLSRKSKRKRRRSNYRRERKGKITNPGAFLSTYRRPRRSKWTDFVFPSTLFSGPSPWWWRERRLIWSAAKRLHHRSCLPSTSCARSPLPPNSFPADRVPPGPRLETERRASIKGRNHVFVSHSTICFSRGVRTGTGHFERRTDDMVSVVLQADVIMSGHQRRVPDFVALVHFGAVHRHFAGTVDRYGQCPGSRVTGVHDEIGLVS